MKTLMRLMLVASVALMPALVFAGPAAAEEGGKKVTAELCKHPTGASFRNRGQCVRSAPKRVPIQPGPQPSWSLQLDQGQPYNCSPPSPGAQCWGTLTASGLAPFSVVHVIGSGFTGTHATVTMDGTVSVDLNLPCNVNKVQAQGTAGNGMLTSPTQAVNPPDPCSTGA